MHRSSARTLLLGILIGVFSTCMFVFMFSTSNVTLRIAPRKKNSESAKLLNTEKQNQNAVQEPRFDFYTELVQTNSETATNNLTSAPKAINGYLLQAGCFKRNADADSIKAKLMLNGYTARIETSKDSSGEVCNRVILGVFKTEQNAKTMQKQLKALAIDSALVANYAN